MTRKAIDLGRQVAVAALLLAASSTAANAQAAQANSSNTKVTPQGGSSNAPAPAAEPPAVEQIIVTAQKRSENVQNVPISISAFNGATLRNANISGLSDLTRLVPTFRYGSGPGTVAARNDIRGLGSFGNSAIEPSVATFLDGVYVPRAGSLNAGLIDVQNIQVLSGPQGTLFGRNASVGAITIETTQPTDRYEGVAAAEVGSGDRYRGELVLNAPVSDRVALRFAGLAEAFAGYWRHEPDGKRFGGLNTYTSRLTARINLTDNLTWIVRGDGQKQNGDGWNNVSIVPGSGDATALTNFSRFLGGQLPGIGISDSSPNDITTAHVNDYHWGVSSNLSWKLPDDFTVRLIDSYRHWRADETDGEVTYTPVPLVDRHYIYDSRSQNHELQLVSPKDKLLGGRLDFVGGLYYFSEDLDIDYYYNLRADWCSVVIANLAAPLVAPCNAGAKNNAFYALFPQRTESYAGYAQATYKILSNLELTLGGRYTSETKNAEYDAVKVNPAAIFGANEDSRLHYSQGRFTDRINLSWKPQKDLMFFTTYSTGFKAGGFNSGSAQTVLGQLRDFNPETVTNYEVGAKSQLLDRRLTADITLYRMDVVGFQERAIDGLTPVVRNVGNIRNEGVEATVSATPVNWLRLNAGLAYLDSIFTSYLKAPAVGYSTGVQNLSGTTPTYAPRWTTSFGAEFRQNLDGGYRWTLRGDVNTVSAQNINAVNDNNPFTVQKGYGLLSGRITLYTPDDKWTLALFGTNLTDVKYCDNDGYQVLGAQLGAEDPGKSLIIRCFRGNPRTIGARIGTTF